MNSAPEGWKLVPVVPDEKMGDAAANEEDYSCRITGGSAAFIDIWYAMLDAAPEPPTVKDSITVEPVAHTFYILYDATECQKYIKKDVDDGCLAIFEREEDAQRAKRRHPGTEYKRVDYYAAPQPAEQQPAPDVTALVEALDGAARSLETISKQSGIDEYMRDFLEVRGYARNRAMVAFEALAAHRKEGGES